MRQSGSVKRSIAYILSVGVSAAALSACGGAESNTGTTAAASTASQNLVLTAALPPADALPAYHLAQAFLDEPDDLDRTDPSTSATREPLRVAIRSDLAGLSSRRLTRQMMQQVLDTGSAPENAFAQGTEADPMASTSGITVYTPAQIRAAYGLPPLPGAGASVTSVQAAQLGASQTIYIIDSNDDPNAAAELAAFNTKFGLPACTTTPILPSTKLPLPTASTAGCVFSVVYVNDYGAVVATPPAYNANWATEIAIDVQWAHATAPYARIVLIEAPDAATTTFAAAARLINTMGPGVVSMSFGAAEGSWTSTFDVNFSAPNMTYLAAAGDSGTEVEWPAVSPYVVAVAGTSLSYSGSGPRTESVWSGTGGGVSAYVPAPAYQALTVPGLNALTHRQVSDVAFNADPNTGQYIAVISKGASSTAWMSAGGTSLATPQWAGIIAVGNAVRAQNSKAMIGSAQALLYGLATQHASYTSSYLDVTKGSDGSCLACSATVGYDLPSGLGTPNVASLLSAVSGAPAATAPIVSAATVSGKTGASLTFSLNATGGHPLTYSLSSAPTGMSVNPTSGLVSWAAPVVGSYAVIATALDPQTGLSGQGTITVTIVAPQPPQVTGGNIAGVAQTALTFTTQVTDANGVTYSLSGAPSGMTVSTAGVVSWPSPVTGTFPVTLTAKDATTGLTGHGVYTVTIAPPAAPVVTATSASFAAGKALSFNAKVQWSNPLTYTLSGAPSGMSIASATGLISWVSPVVGTYAVKVTAKDTKTSLTGSGIYTITITPSGPIITATSLSGVAGTPVTGSVSITDSTATSISVTISGMPAGMSASANGSVLTFTWTSPVAGTYSVRISATDNKNLTGSATIPVVISTH